MRPTSRVAQPDFTAECIQAQSRGVKAFTLLADSNSVRRLASSCTRQGFKPAYFAYSLSITTDLERDLNLEGLVAVQATFPWVLADTPQTLAYQAAMKRFAPSVGLSSGVSQAWTAGKLLERALAGRSEVSRTSIVEGLWGLANETLGGLAPPLTFRRDQPAPAAQCFFVMEIVKGKWAAPQGANVECVS